jgi:NAD(P)-dependent dehydrogenase (short-subunit alcohol dehydrogenase family)
VLDVHLRGAWLGCQHVVAGMRERRRGAIVNLSSESRHGSFGQSNYAAAKAGIVGMVRTWAMELARAEITVNAIVPVAATAMTETVPFLKPYIDALETGGPLAEFGRRELSLGTPQDAAGVVAFLASDAAAGITGQAVGIGGDRLALWTHPTEAVVDFADGTGWSADAIAGVWPDRFAPSHQTVGQQFPEPPAKATAE